MGFIFDYWRWLLANVVRLMGYGHCIPLAVTPSASGQAMQWAE
jgi:hypothetical protein